MSTRKDTNMKVILLQDVKAHGKKGQIVEVSDGYARNFIIPKKLGVEATSKNLNDLKLQKANDEKVAKELLEAAQAFAKELEGKTVKVKMKTGEGGRTFGSVSTEVESSPSFFAITCRTAAQSLTSLVSGPAWSMEDA